MQRKKFIKNLIGASIGASTLVGCANNSPENNNNTFSIDNVYKWKMVTTWPPNFPILGEGCALFAKWVEEMSRGQMRIHVYGGGELVPPLETFEAVSIGGVELGNGASYYWAGKVAAAQFFAAVPFGFNAQQMNAWLTSGGGLDLWREVYAPFNLIPFNCGNTGLQMGGWYNKRIDSPEDLRGLKMRIPGLGGKVLRSVGGTPILSAGSEIYTNLERGVIDATEWLGPFHDQLMGFHEIAKYYYYPGWHECGSALEMIVNKKKFEELPVHLQQIIETACWRLRAWMLDEFEAKNAEALASLKSNGNVEILPLPQSVIDVLRQASINSLNEIAESDELTKRVFESFKTFKTKISGWSDLSEKMYYQKLNG